MTSEKQIVANHQNAFNAGVKTPVGKLVTRLNAVSHGIFSKEVLLPGEDAALLARLRENMCDELKPVGELETVLVERIICAIWRLKRVLRTEQNYGRPSAEDYNNVAEYFHGIDYRYSGWQKYSRYETTLERQIYKAMTALERLQRIRQGEKLPLPPSIDVHISSDGETD
jgi:hypothetical protein